jgi:hypothetical protein
MKIHGLIKDAIIINDDTLIYRVVQFITLTLYTITNENAFDTFEIQLRPCFFQHTNKCNTIKDTQMTYGRFTIIRVQMQ